MAVGFSEEVKEKLAIAVKSIEWSYAIFWTISASQPGVLEWGDGYYNGDIKTRKTVQAAETTNNDQLGLQRTERLRELYESLLAGDMNQQERIPSTALSPEDLTDTEWYFLVCMSFVFNIGQGLPGKALAKNQTIWLSNAPQEDGRVFTRALLAKSASIQTVVCFPQFGGVIELGVSEPVIEDLNLIQHIKTSYLNIPQPIVHGVSNYIPTDHINHIDAICATSEASQGQRCQFAEDDTSNGVHNSANSSDCISHNCYVEEPMKRSPHEHQECHQGYDGHYQTVLFSVLKSSHQFLLGPYFSNANRESSFVGWKKEISPDIRTPVMGASQRLLKRALSGIARMPRVRDVEKDGDGKNIFVKHELDEADRSRVLSERRRREKINERFVALASLIPNSGKADKVSILDDTIEYLKDLKRRVCEAKDDVEKDIFETNARMGRNCEYVERMSDNCGANTNDDDKKLLLPNKRKACEMEAVSKGAVKNVLTRDIAVSVADEDATVEIRCEWSEGVLFKIIRALDNLHLDCETIQSSRGDGILSLTIKCKAKALKVTSSARIKQTLKRVI